MHRTHRLLLFAVLLGVLSPALADGDFLIDADWLAEHIDDDNLVVLEVRYHPHRYFTVGHVPGAVQVQRFRDLGDNAASPLMRFPPKEAFQATLRRSGVNDGSTLVIYDDASTALASRLYFLLALYGFDLERVKVLDGGTIEWSAFNELSKDPVERAPGTVTLKEADPRLFVEWTAVYDDVVSRRAPGVVLVDARPRAMYTGEVIQHSIVGGHIPGAINVVSLEGTDGQSQKWRDDGTLAVAQDSHSTPINLRTRPQEPHGSTEISRVREGRCVRRKRIRWSKSRHVFLADSRSTSFAASCCRRIRFRALSIWSFSISSSSRSPPADRHRPGCASRHLSMACRS